MSGPAWLGLGAQRAGTTWLTDMLLEHPRVGTAGTKELHQLYRGLMDPWGEKEIADYEERFANDDGMLLGECTPYYLRGIWAAHIVARVAPQYAPIFVILRDPIERFESAIRHELTRGDRKGLDPHRQVPTKWIRFHGSNAVWGGMYATQLEAWASVLGRDRLTVFQYETAIKDPQGTVDVLWKQMNLDPVPVANKSTETSRTTSNHDLWELDSVSGLRDQLRGVFAKEVDRLGDWGIDKSHWRNFA